MDKNEKPEKKKRKLPVQSPRMCLYCDKEYQPRSLNQRYCSEECQQAFAKLSKEEQEEQKLMKGMLPRYTKSRIVSRKEKEAHLTIPQMRFVHVYVENLGQKLTYEQLAEKANLNISSVKAYMTQPVGRFVRKYIQQLIDLLWKKEKHELLYELVKKGKGEAQKTVIMRDGRQIQVPIDARDQIEATKVFFQIIGELRQAAQVNVDARSVQVNQESEITKMPSLKDLADIPGIEIEEIKKLEKEDGLHN